uniref:Interferon-induced transmembrane protein 1-like n=1 Tax=Sus scrofa TaxID=9823 RepID=A0A480JAD5_PIG
MGLSSAKDLPPACSQTPKMVTGKQCHSTSQPPPVVPTRCATQPGHGQGGAGGGRDGAARRFSSHDQHGDHHPQGDPPPGPRRLVAVQHPLPELVLPGLRGFRLLREGEGPEDGGRHHWGPELCLHRQVPEHLGSGPGHFSDHRSRRSSGVCMHSSL